MIKLSFESQLNVDKNVLIEQAFSMPGVNFELSPWIKLTYPKGAGADPLKENIKAPGRFLFKSWFLVLGLIPIDYYSFYFISLCQEGHFHESSSSLTYKKWYHIRDISSSEEGSFVKDDLEITPRLPVLSPLIRFLVRLVFLHRHNVLRKKYNKS
ncbi:MAG: hypothetical protein CME68_04160 [Halobacteriovoraceae bacterium]|nr:hypothetical protein [Halobacteriovoraceae bacterium]